jgi:site-specific DNA-methyltransferase (adenine-specific)
MRLILGDCLEAMRALPDGSVDAVIADQPYGTTACKWDAVIPFAPLWEQLRRVAKPNAAFVFTASQPFTAALVMSNAAWFRHEWVWLKNRGSNFANTMREPMKEHESVLVFSRGGWTYNRPLQERAPTGLARVKLPFRGRVGGEGTRPMGEDRRTHVGPLRVPSSWQKFNTEVGLHPTQKPVDLLVYLVRTYTNPGDTVLDFCMGSGTTGVACAREGRDFIGIEREAAYFQTAEQRIAGERLPLFAAVD